MFWKLTKEVESNAALIRKLSPFSSYGCLELWVMPELVVVFNQLRDFIQKDLRINKHYVWEQMPVVVDDTEASQVV